MTFRAPRSADGAARRRPAARRAAWLTPGVLALLAAARVDAAPQPGSVVPPSLEPGRIERSIERPEERRAPAGAFLPLTPGQPPPPAAAEMTFVFQALRIDGATELPLPVLMAEWPHRPGDTVSVADVFRLAGAITRRYASAGYALSYAAVPEQEIEGGIVTIRVIEGFIDEVELSVGGKAAPVRKLAERIRQSKPLRTDDLERNLLLMNDLPGVQVRATISPSPDTPGGGKMELAGERQSITAEVGYNSYLPRELDRHLVGGSIAFQGLITGTDRIRISGAHSPSGNAYWNVAGEAATGVGVPGLTTGVSAIYSNSRPVSALLRSLAYQGRTLGARAWVDYALVRSRRQNLFVQLSAALSDSDSDLLGQAEMRDRLRFIGASLAYDYAAADQSLSSVRVGAEQGLGVWAAGGNSRANGDETYSLLTLDLERTQPIAEAFGGMLAAVLSAQGQATLRGALFSTTECGYGGRQFGRRFDNGEILGDHCLLGALELRWSRATSAFGGNTPIGVQLYGFADGGVTWQAGALQPAEARRRSAASAGGGARFDLGGRVSGSIEVSRALATPPGSDVGNDARGTGALTVRF